MRISTGQWYRQGVSAMLNSQAALSKTQLQLATGQRMLAPSDDPAAATKVLELDQLLSSVSQFQRNGDAAEARLRREENVLEGAGDSLQRVRELARFRSEFFGRLRRILSNRSDVSIVGDRFVFQSEVLFSKGETEINPAGARELNKLAEAIKQLEKEIPSDIAWVLRVDGHTDSDPIHTSLFKSNWELSAARAIAVVKQLVAKGVPPQRLVAAGFGEFQPIADGDSEEAKARNRRIELKLTER